MRTSGRHLCKMSWGRLQKVLVLKAFLRDVLMPPWNRLEDVLKTYGQDKYIGLDQDVFKTSSEDVWRRPIYSSWSRRLLKTKTKDVFKTSSRRLHQDECLLRRIFWKCIQYIIHWDKIQILRNFSSGKIKSTKNALFFLSRAPTHHTFTFNLRLLGELKHKARLSKTVDGIFHFWFRFAFIKVYIFVQQNACWL